MDSKGTIHIGEIAYSLRRGKKSGGMGDRSRRRVVRRQARGKAGRHKLQEKDSKGTSHVAKNTYLLHRGKPAGEVGDRGKGHTVRGRAWGKAAAGKPSLQEKDSKGLIQTAGDTNRLRRAMKNRGMGDRSRRHVVRGRAWGKAATGRNKLQEKDSKDMIHTAGYTYALYWERNGGEWGSRRGWAVRWREVHVTCKYMHVTHSTPTCR